MGERGGAQTNANPETPFRMDARKERAALLLAEDERPDGEIAATVGVHVSTLWRWRQHPDFAARVGDHVGALQAAMLRYRVAKKRERMRVLDDLHAAELAVIDARAARYAAKLGDDPEAVAASAARRVFAGKDRDDADIPAEAATGLLVEKETVNNAGHRTVEWAVDTGLLREIRATHEQAAKELGQWVERTEANGTQVVQVVGIDAGAI